MEPTTEDEETAVDKAADAATTDKDSDVNRLAGSWNSTAGHMATAATAAPNVNQRRKDTSTARPTRIARTAATPAAMVPTADGEGQH